jgi:hypothetical protein
MAMKPETKRALKLTYQIGFPVVLLTLRLLGRRYPWAKNTHEVLRRVK